MLVCACYLFFARETAGAASTRRSLRPLFSRAKNFSNDPGASRRGVMQSRREDLISTIAGAGGDAIPARGFELLGEFLHDLFQMVPECPGAGRISQILESSGSIIRCRRWRPSDSSMAPPFPLRTYLCSLPPVATAIQRQARTSGERQRGDWIADPSRRDQQNTKQNTQGERQC